VSNVIIEIFCRGSSIKTVITNESGLAVVTGLIEGEDYTFRTIVNGFSPGMIGLLSVTDTQYIYLNESDIMERALIFRILDEGEPVSGASVTISNPNPSQPFITAVSNPQGFITFDYLWLGFSYAYTVTMPDGLTFTGMLIPPTYTYSAYREITTACPVTFTFTNELDMPIANARLTSAAFGENEEHRTDENGTVTAYLKHGEYSFTVIPQESYYNSHLGSYTVAAADFSAGSKSVSAVLPVLRETKTYMVFGIDRQPLEGACVTVGGPIPVSGTTGLDGTVTLDVCIVSDSVSVSARGYISKTLENGHCQLTPETYEYTITVVDAVPVSGATVILTSVRTWPEPVVFIITTDGSGLITANLTFGDWEYTVNAYAAAERKGTLSVNPENPSEYIGIIRTQQFYIYETDEIPFITSSFSVEIGFEIYSFWGGNTFSLPLSPGEYAVNISANGYIPMTTYVTVSDYRRDIGIQVSSASINFTATVKWDNWNIQYATITFYEGLSEAGTQTTNYFGQASLFLRNRHTYTYTVTAPGGYMQNTGSVTLSGGTAGIVIYMQPETHPLSVRNEETGEALSGARVGVVLAFGMGFIVLYFDTDETGTALLGLPYGEYNYSILKDGYYPVNKTLSIGDGSDLGTVLLEWIAFSATFTVKDGELPIAGARVEMTGQFNSYSGETDANGSFQINAVPGVYAYTVTAYDYKPASYIYGNFSFYEDCEFAVSLARVEHPVEVWVFSAENPVGGAAVSIGGMQAYANAEGMASFNLTAGEYDIEVVKNEFITCTGSITVERGSNTITLQILPVKLDATVTVLFDTGGAHEPVGGAVIDINGQTVTTDENGVITISLPRGVYSFTVTAGGYANYGGTITVEAEDVEQDVFVLPAEYTTTFSILFANPGWDGGSVDATVTVTPAGGGAPLTARVGSDFTVRLGLPAGSYTYSVTAANYQVKTGSFTIAEGATPREGERTLNVRLEGYAAAFTVAYEGNPVSGVSLGVFKTIEIEGVLTEVQAAAVTTDAEGKAAVHLPYGVTYRYVVSKNDYESVGGTFAFDLTEPIGADLQISAAFTTYRPKYAVTFSVTSEGAAVQGAAVAINGTQYLTDASGSVVISLADDTYAYTVSKDFYVGRSGGFTVDGAALAVSEDIDFALEPGEYAIYLAEANTDFVQAAGLLASQFDITWQYIVGIFLSHGDIYFARDVMKAVLENSGLFTDGADAAGTENWVVLLHACGVSSENLMKALSYAFDAAYTYQEAYGLLDAGGYAAVEIASAMRLVYKLSAAAFVTGFMGVEFTIEETYHSLKEAYLLSEIQVFPALTSPLSTRNAVYDFYVSMLGEDITQAAAWMKGCGFADAQIIWMLKFGYDAGVNAIFASLDAAETGIWDIVSALRKEGIDLGFNALVAVLKATGYTAENAASVIQDLTYPESYQSGLTDIYFNAQNKPKLGAAMRLAGFTAWEVAGSVRTNAEFNNVILILVRSEFAQSEVLDVVFDIYADDMVTLAAVLSETYYWTKQSYKAIYNEFGIEGLAKAVTDIGEKSLNWRIEMFMMAMYDDFAGLSGIDADIFRKIIAASGNTRDDLAWELSFYHGLNYRREEILAYLVGEMGYTFREYLERGCTFFKSRPADVLNEYFGITDADDFANMINQAVRLIYKDYPSDVWYFLKRELTYGLGTLLAQNDAVLFKAFLTHGAYESLETVASFIGNSDYFRGLSAEALVGVMLDAGMDWLTVYRYSCQRAGVVAVYKAQGLLLMDVLNLYFQITSKKNMYTFYSYIDEEGEYTVEDVAVVLRHIFNYPELTAFDIVAAHLAFAGRDESETLGIVKEVYLLHSGSVLVSMLKENGVHNIMVAEFISDNLDTADIAAVAEMLYDLFYPELEAFDMITHILRATGRDETEAALVISGVYNTQPGLANIEQLKNQNAPASEVADFIADNLDTTDLVNTGILLRNAGYAELDALNIIEYILQRIGQDQSKAAGIITMSYKLVSGVRLVSLLRQKGAQYYTAVEFIKNNLDISDPLIIGKTLSDSGYSDDDVFRYLYIYLDFALGIRITPQTFEFILDAEITIFGSTEETALENAVDRWWPINTVKYGLRINKQVIARNLSDAGFTPVEFITFIKEHYDEQNFFSMMGLLGILGYNRQAQKEFIAEVYGFEPEEMPARTLPFLMAEPEYSESFSMELAGTIKYVISQLTKYYGLSQEEIAEFVAEAENGSGEPYFSAGEVLGEFLYWPGILSDLLFTTYGYNTKEKMTDYISLMAYYSRHNTFTIHVLKDTFGNVEGVSMGDILLAYTKLNPTWMSIYTNTILSDYPRDMSVAMVLPQLGKYGEEMFMTLITSLAFTNEEAALIMYELMDYEMDENDYYYNYVQSRAYNLYTIVYRTYYFGSQSKNIQTTEFFMRDFVNGDGSLIIPIEEFLEMYFDMRLYDIWPYVDARHLLTAYVNTTGKSLPQSVRDISLAGYAFHQNEENGGQFIADMMWKWILVYFNDMELYTWDDPHVKVAELMRDSGLSAYDVIYGAILHRDSLYGTLRYPNVSKVYRYISIIINGDFKAYLREQGISTSSFHDYYFILNTIHCTGMFDIDDILWFMIDDLEISSWIEACIAVTCMGYSGWKVLDIILSHHGYKVMFTLDLAMIAISAEKVLMGEANLIMQIVFRVIDIAKQALGEHYPLPI